jgi:hypothetical protein
MAQNFIEGGREQGFLLPPDVRGWLAADHLAWFVIDAVGEMDLSAFYAAYRAARTPTTSNAAATAPLRRLRRGLAAV